VRGGECGHDHRQDVVDPEQDVVVPEADHAESLRLQPARARIVVRRAIEMLAAVDFDDQPDFQTDEVRDESADGVLSSELPVEQAPVAHALPQRTFGIGLLPAQGAFAMMGARSAHGHVPEGGRKDAAMDDARGSGLSERDVGERRGVLSGRCDRCADGA
jgi:hypothetical protein